MYEMSTHPPIVYDSLIAGVVYGEVNVKWEQCLTFKLGFGVIFAFHSPKPLDLQMSPVGI
jgi:hypothetical protein